MLSISIQDLKKNGALALSDTMPTYLIKHSKIEHVIVPKAMFEELVEAQEDLEDLIEIQKRKGEPTIPFEEVAREILGEDYNSEHEISHRNTPQREKRTKKAA